jgi:Transposase DDE domain group 1
VASPPTVWRMLDELTPGRVEAGGAGAGADPRARLGLFPAVPASRVAGVGLGEMIVLDADATLVPAHSEKQQVAATFKGGYGFHPIGVWCDNTAELLAITLRPGNAGSNHAGDHIEVLTRAIAQVFIADTC